tara:strand:- start:206 stop:1702 length:1497 start_codon:yes stop_codon:yes gene_type:complete
MRVTPDLPSVPHQPWSASVRSAKLVNSDGQEHTGPWNKSLRLRVELMTAIPEEELQGVSSSLLDTRWGRILGIAEHPTYHGLFYIARVEATTVHCLVPQYDDSWKPLAYDVRPPPARNRNMSTLWWEAGAKQVGEATAFIAPPLLFHARMSVFSIDSIDTVAQTFRASSYIELRLRAIVNEADDKLVGLLLAVFGFSTNMVAMMNVVESVRDPEVWSSFGQNHFPENESMHDYSLKIRTHDVIAEEFELHAFPFDSQPLHLLLTLNIPCSRAVITPNLEFPSVFLHKAFQLKAVFDVVYLEQLHSELSFSDPDESSARYIYPRMSWSLTLRRRYGWYVTNVVLPIGLLAFLTALTIGVREADGSRMGTADRLGLTFTLMLTAVAYKFVVATSIPDVSYQTDLDVYVMLCFLWMLFAALENALYPEFGYDRSSGEPVERMDEYVLMAAYLASFLLVNLLYWLCMGLKLRSRNAATRREFDTERQRRDDAAKALAESYSA